MFLFWCIKLSYHRVNMEGGGGRGWNWGGVGADSDQPKPLYMLNCLQK